MANVRYSAALAAEYELLYDTVEVSRERFREVDRLVDSLLRNRARYEAVAQGMNGLPWYLIAAIHNMESSQNFSRHLHNGDPLSARTVQVPSGRPRVGTPPFTWEDSAVDALKMHRLHQIDDWSLGRVLYEAEAFNGWGYRVHHPEVLTPYLWSFCNHYTRGKYVADGRWSSTAVSRQCGLVVLIRRLEERQEIGPLTAVNRAPLISYSDRVVARADDLQRFLNTFVGVTLRVDGKPGEKTSDAVEKLLGNRLQGDPRP